MIERGARRGKVDGAEEEVAGHDEPANDAPAAPQNDTRAGGAAGEAAKAPVATPASPAATKPAAAEKAVAEKPRPRKEEARPQDALSEMPRPTLPTVLEPWRDIVRVGWRSRNSERSTTPATRTRRSIQRTHGVSTSIGSASTANRFAAEISSTISHEPST